MSDSALSVSPGKRVWAPRQTVATVLGMTAQNFDARIRPQLPAEAHAGHGRNLAFDVAIVVATWHRMELERVKGAARSVGEDPLMDAGGDSPGLERYRNASADLREMERDRLRKHTVRVDELEPALLQLTGVIRGAGEDLARRYGNDAATIVNEAANEWFDGCQRLFAGLAAPAGSAADVDSSVSVTLDAPVRGGRTDSVNRTARRTEIQD